MNDHILSHYDTSLRQARQQVAELGENILLQLDYLQNLLTEKEEKWGNKVIAQLDPLMEQNKAILHFHYSILSQFHPVAKDLRLVLMLIRCTEKMETTITQLGRLARRGKNIIQHTTSKTEDIQELLMMAHQEFNQAVESLKTLDATPIFSIKSLDKILDKKYKKLTKSLIAQPCSENESPVLDVDKLFFIRSVERIGDHAKSLATALLYLYSEPIFPQDE